PPQYDLNLVFAELQAAMPSDAPLGAEEVLRVQPWYEIPLPEGKVRSIYWITMIVVVIGLLAVIAKLLPAESSTLR
ncbi:MAG TPA: hypothetical protein VMU17_03330, partial [Elusimicrobiota bacterium]|nr:hypothetical protein [Elusimicrobiota bacterium]